MAKVRTWSTLWWAWLGLETGLRIQVDIATGSGPGGGGYGQVSGQGK